MKGKILVSIQFICIALMIVVTSWFLLSTWILIPFAASGFLLIWAVLAMRPGNFNIIPAPVEKGILVTRGPYRLIRHPMYTSIFIVSFALLAFQFDYTKLTINLVLIIGLTVKMLYEESLLCVHFPAYKAYMGKTWRVVPGVW